MTDYVDRRLWRFDPVTGEPLRPDLAEVDLARVGEIGVWGEQPEPEENKDDKS